MIPAQYAAAVRLGVYGACALVLLVLLGLGFAGGMRWNAGEAAEARAETTKVEGERDQWRTASNGWELATERWKARYAAEQREADDMADAAAEALLERDRQQDKAAREAAAWQERFDAMSRQPECAALARETACPVFQSY